MNCPLCGNIIESEAQFCGDCGAAVETRGVGAIGLVQAIQLGFQNYANFSGRSNRAEYWWWALVVVAFALNVLMRVFLEPLGFVASLFGLGTFCLVWLWERDACMT